MNETNRLPTIILLLAAVGVPTAAGLAFAEQVTENPVAALLLALLYEVVVLVFGLISKVWKKLESRWVDSIADRLDIALRGLFSHYEKKYMQHLIYRHRSFDVKGLTTQGIYTLGLEQVFVELSVAPQPAHQISSDPIRVVPKTLREGRHDVWDYLTSGQMEDHNLAIIGPPGSGKTTLVKHIALTLALGKKARRAVKAPDKLPILLFLRDQRDAIVENADITLAQIVEKSVARNEAEVAKGWFDAQLKSGRCLVMLDGLDELADPDIRKLIVAWVENQMVAYARNQFIITSRPFGYSSNPLSGVTVLEVRPFTMEQVGRFVHNWYSANEIMSAQKDDPGIHLVARQGANDLLHRIRKTPPLAAMAVNPLLLTMIATVHRYRSRLPGRRVELYAEICEVFLGKRQEARGLTSDLTPAQKQRVLQPLAYHMMTNEQREIKLRDALAVITEPLARVSPQYSGEEFLKMIENSSGLLLERENNVYSFAHLTFQEYMASVHAHDQDVEYELVARVEETWWHETIRLYVAQADATPIIDVCLSSGKPSVAALTLAIECVEEAREVQPTLRSQLETILAQGVEDEDPERRRIVTEALLALRLRRMIRLDENKYIDDSFITHAEYQLFLDEQRVHGEYRQPDHWSGYQFPHEHGRDAVTGVRPSDAIAFCKWLTQRESSPWQYRLPLEGELEMYASSETSNGNSASAFGCWITSFNNDSVVLEMTNGAREAKGRSTLNPEYDIASTIDPDIELSSELRDAHDAAVQRALERGLNLDRTHASVLASDLALDLTEARGLTHERNDARDLEKASANILARDYARAHDLSNILARNRARAMRLASDRVLAHSHVLTRERADDPERARELDLTLTRARTSAEHMASDLANARALSHILRDTLDPTRSFANDFDLSQVLSSELEHALTYASKLDSALANAHDLANAAASDLDHARARARARTLTDAQEEQLDQKGAQDLAQTLDRANDRFSALERDLSHTGDLASGLASALANIRTRIRELVRIHSISLANDLLHLMDMQRAGQSWTQRLRGNGDHLRAWRDEVQRHVSTYLDLHIDFVTLEERIQGNLPALEGIRIVRERVESKAENS